MPLPFRICLNLAYLLVLAVASPVIAWRAVRHGKYVDGWSEKLLGRLPVLNEHENVVWFHAVSVGEVLQLETIVPRFTRLHPDATVLITTTTGTGLEIARERFGQHHCCYFPLDFSWSVRRALKRVQPKLAVLVELELWPTFVFEASRTAQVAIINGRMSDNSFRGYSRIRFLIEPVLKRIAAIGVQTEEYGRRLESLGGQNVEVTGSIKFDRVETNRNNSGTDLLRQLFSIAEDDVVLIAGSTQSPEEDFAVEAWESLRNEIPNLRLIIVPRHKERFNDVANLIEARGGKLVRRSLLNGPETIDPEAVILLDTLGELSHCWGLADVAFVGGSFGDRGGQNMIEPAAFGCAVVVGPNTTNFRDIVVDLNAKDAIQVVQSPSDFQQALHELLIDEPRRTQMGVAAAELVQTQSGASSKTIELLESLWKPGTQQAAGRSAA
jgi:3-deoxy-D-manno-octulosonic-acid transferase